MFQWHFRLNLIDVLALFDDEPAVHIFASGGVAVGVSITGDHEHVHSLPFFGELVTELVELFLEGAAATSPSSGIEDDQEVSTVDNFSKGAVFFLGTTFFNLEVLKEIYR